MGVHQATLPEKAARLSLGSNLLLVVIKIVTGIMSGSISVLAEGIQSTVDVVASAVILWTVRHAAAPPDRDHPYGHGKFENLASVGQMVLILGSAAYLLYAAWERWNAPRMPRLDWGIAALGTATVVNIFVSRHLFRVARETRSHALEAEAMHLRSDLISCVGVLIGLVVVGITGYARLDPLIAAGMTGYVVYSALNLLRNSLRPLADESLPAEDLARLQKVLDSDPRVLSYHRIRTRQAGSQQFVDLHVLMDDDLTLVQAHRIGEEVEAALREVLPNANVMAHIEPFRDEMRHQEEHHREDGE